MDNQYIKIGIICHNYFGRRFDRFLPIYNSYPQNMDSICKYQHFNTGLIKEKIILTLFFIDNKYSKTYKKIDITNVCIQNSPMKLCIVKTEANYELLVYCNKALNGKFNISDYKTLDNL